MHVCIYIGMGVCIYVTACLHVVTRFDASPQPLCVATDRLQDQYFLVVSPTLLLSWRV